MNELVVTDTCNDVERAGCDGHILSRVERAGCDRHMLSWVERAGCDGHMLSRVKTLNLSEAMLIVNLVVYIPDW